jgi:hypothetical protein
MGAPPPRDKQADRPCRRREHDTRRHDGPPRNVDRPKLEAVDGVPDEMTDTPAQMKEESEGAAEQHDLAGPGFDHALNDTIGLGTGSGRAQPNHHAHGTEAQN